MDIKLITSFDILYSIVLLFIIFYYANNVKRKNIVEQPSFKYFTKGLFIKIFGAISFCLIYALYYKGGDTVNYFKGVNAMFNAFKHDPFKYFVMIFNSDTKYARHLFWDAGIFPPGYMLRDPRTFLVIKLSSVISLVGLGGFLPTTILLASLVYNWVWKLFDFMYTRYPKHQKEVVIAILYLPSTIFWGSGIMKDTFTFAATCYTVYGLHTLFILRERKLKVILQLIFSFYLIITIKSYIIFALLPGLLIFANFERLKSIKSIFVKIFIIPISIVALIFVSKSVFIDFSDLFGKYSADRILEEAAIQNADLQRSVYGENSFNIGEFEPSLQGVLAKIPIAINAAIFRPYIWEVGSPTMWLSGIENLLILILTVWLIITRPFSIFKIFKDPFLIFCLLFTLILGFGIGLSTSNFGALVRYKIPFLPFFLFLIFVLLQKDKKKKVT
jgi:hypothetical protein